MIHRLPKLTFALLIVMTTSAYHAQAQTPDVLVPDETISVMLRAEQPVTLTFEGREGDTIDIETRATGQADLPDTTIRIIDPSLHPLAYGDDVQQMDENGQITILRDAALYDLLLPETGTYTLLVDSFNGVSSGPVDVTLRESDPFAAQVEATDTGTIIRAQLPINRIFSHELAVSAGDLLSIRAVDQSDTLDPVLTVRDADGDIIAANDDHGDPTELSLNLLDARIDELEIAADGIIVVQVHDFSGQAGAIEIHIDRR